MSDKNLNNLNLNRSKKILLNIADYPKNPKFSNLAKHEVIRAKSFRNENTTKQIKYQRYKRGTVIFVHFGINTGSEFSNSHFAIVLDKQDHPNNGKLTVLPLTSKNSSTSISIEKAIFTSIMDDTEEKLNKVKEVLNLTNDLEHLHHLLPQPPNFFRPTPSAKNYDTWMEFYNRHDPDGIHVPVATETVRQWIEEDQDKINNLKELYKSYNKVSYAKLDSITSISKFKIAKPINNLDPVGNIVLPVSVMEQIDKDLAKKLLSGAWKCTIVNDVIPKVKETQT